MRKMIWLLFETAERRLIRTRAMTYDQQDPWADLLTEYEEAKSEGPGRRTKTSMQNYLKYRNRRRWKRLQKDFLWAKRELARIPHCNPEDARFLL